HAFHKTSNRSGRISAGGNSCAEAARTPGSTTPPVHCLARIIRPPRTPWRVGETYESHGYRDGRPARALSPAHVAGIPGPPHGRGVHRHRRGRARLRL